MKILCFVPMHPDYGIRPQTVDSIMALEHDDVLDIHFSQHDNPYEPPEFHYNWNIKYQHNKAKWLTLERGYDALLSVEADMIVPPDTIGRLIEADADIAYGLYVWREVKRWNAYKELGLWGGKSVSLNHSGSDARAAWGNIIDVEGAGMGCTLISRDVLEALRFRLLDGGHSWIDDEYANDFKALDIDSTEDRSGMLCDDWFLAMDAKHHGFSQRNNLNVVCGHIDGDTVLWPDPTVDKLYRTEPV